MHGSNQWNVMLHSSTKMLSDIHHSGNSPIPFSSASGQAHTKTPFSFLGCRMRLRSGLILTPHRLCSQPLKNRTSLTNHLPKCWMVIIVIIFYATYLHPPFDPRKRWLGFCLIRFQPRLTDCSHVSLLALGIAQEAHLSAVAIWLLCATASSTAPGAERVPSTLLAAASDASSLDFLLAAARRLLIQ